MEKIVIERTKSSPFISLDPETHAIQVRGESYPENAARLYEPVFAWLDAYLAEANSNPLTVDVALLYFNSSSSKIFMNFFEMLDRAADAGRKVVVNWHYHPENETSLECGEEFKEDLVSLIFNLQPTYEA